MTAPDPAEERGRASREGGEVRVWADYDDRCIVCTQPKEVLRAYGVGQQCHHVLPYSQYGHRGRIVPVCTACHEIVNALQRTFTRFTERAAQATAARDQVA